MMGFWDDMVEKAKEAKKNVEDYTFEKIGEYSGKDPEELKNEVFEKTTEFLDMAKDIAKNAGDTISKQFGYDDFESLKQDKIDPLMGEAKKYMDGAMEYVGIDGGKKIQIGGLRDFPKEYKGLEPIDRKTFIFKTVDDLTRSINSHAKEMDYDGDVAAFLKEPVNKDGVVEIEVEYYIFPKKNDSEV